jgi:hypothetical protein
MFLGVQRFWVLGSGFRVQRFRVQGSGFKSSIFVPELHLGCVFREISIFNEDFGS